MLAHVQNIHVSGADFPREEWVRDMGLALCRRCKNLGKGGEACRGPGCGLAREEGGGDMLAEDPPPNELGGGGMLRT